MRIYQYLNLTNGLERLPEIRGDVRYIRIQSTACEQKHWSELILTLDSDLLLHLARGNVCVVYDYGSRKETPRAVWQGLAFIRHCLENVWFGESKTNANFDAYFAACLSALSEPAKAKLRYYRRFLATDRLRLYTVTAHTRWDSHYDHYALLLNRHGDRTVPQFLGRVWL